jgi:Cft2 family RNA processing exonuclease
LRESAALNEDASEPRADWLVESLTPFLETRPQGLCAPVFDARIDPPVPASRAILTHAHADHAAAGHGEIWCTPETARIYRRRNPDWSGSTREFSYGSGPEAEGTTLRFVPAGHVLGSAQLFFEGGGRSLLYTGDFKRATGRTAVRAESPHATVLLTETTFGLPVFRFPDRRALEARLLEACRDATAAGVTPVVLAYSLGKSQEVATILTEAGIPTVLHGAGWKLLPEYEASGFQFPLSRPYEQGPPAAGEVLVAPPNCARTPMIRNVKRRRIVYCSGWALRAASRADYDADVLLPLSDHADFHELLQHVADVHPQRVITLHGFAHDFARILRGLGVEALPLPAAAERRAEDA